MISPLLLQYIKNQLSRGISKEAVVQKLLKKGWDHKDIEDAFMLTPDPDEKLVEDNNKSRPIFWVFFISFNIFLIVVAVFLVYAYVNNNWPFYKLDLIGDVNMLQKEDQEENSDGRITILSPQAGDIFYPGDKIEIRALVEGNLYNRSLDSFIEIDSVFLSIGASTILISDIKNGSENSFSISVPEVYPPGEIDLTVTAGNSSLSLSELVESSSVLTQTVPLEIRLVREVQTDTP